MILPLLPGRMESVFLPHRTGANLLLWQVECCGYDVRFWGLGLKKSCSFCSYPLGTLKSLSDEEAQSSLLKEDWLHGELRCPSPEPGGGYESFPDFPSICCLCLLQPHSPVTTKDLPLQTLNSTACLGVGMSHLYPQVVLVRLSISLRVVFPCGSYRPWI